MRHLVLRIHTGAVRAAALSTVSRSLVTGSLTIELRGTLCGDALKEIVAVDAGTGGLIILKTKCSRPQNEVYIFKKRNVPCGLLFQRSKQPRRI